MAVILKLTFPAGRYHATPWGRHVNEGVPEWPPSPWRLLRALVAVWKRTSTHLAESQVRRILEPLLHAPSFYLPRYRVAHTRHAMPMNVLPRNYKPSEAERKGGKFQGDPSIIFDTFVALSRHDSVFVGWPTAHLTAEDHNALTTLVGNLSSLGRTEGWVHAELTGEPIAWNCTPVEVGDIVPVLCPDPATALGNEYYPTHTPAQLRRGLKLDELLFDCPHWHLCLDTQTIHEQKWPRVPGAKWVNYSRPTAESTAKPVVSIPKRIRPEFRPTVARFLLDGPVLPSVTETIRVAEAFRREALFAYKRWACREYGLSKEATPATHPQLQSTVLSGKDPTGQHLHSHGHAFYLPADEDSDGRIDHVTVYAPVGLGEGERAALGAVRGVRVEGGEGWRVVQVGLGHARDFRGPLFGPGRVWVSATPFVVTRHPKANGRRRDPPECFGTEGRAAFARLVLAEELERLCARRGELPSAGRIGYHRLDRVGAGAGPGRRVLEFRRSRNKPGDDGLRRAAASFRLEFPEPVAGPLTLGHASHFGLGLFVTEGA